MPTDPFEDHNKHLLHLPDHILRDLGRNEAAPRDYRKAAVELLLNRRSPYAAHTDLQGFVHELEAEMEGIQFEFPAPETAFSQATETGPLSASVTTTTMFSDGPIDNQEPLVPTEIQPPLPTESAHAEVPATRKRKPKEPKNAPE
jgi:hypothetical protein